MYVYEHARALTSNMPLSFGCDTSNSQLISVLDSGGAVDGTERVMWFSQFSVTPNSCPSVDYVHRLPSTSSQHSMNQIIKSEI